MAFKELLVSYGILDASYSGKVAMILCPYHGDTDPSMKINFDRDSFFCFGCNKKGNIIDFISHLEGVDEIEALQKAYSIAKAPLNIMARVNRDVRNEDWSESKRAAKIVYDQIPAIDWCDITQSYMIDERNFSPQILNEFKVKLNIFSEHPVCIPCIMDGEIVGICNRAVRNDVIPKYKFNSGFRKDKCLPGYLDKNWPVVVTEGLIDMMTCYQYGYKNVTTTFNWCASDAHIEILKEYDIICAYDNDKRGDEGFERLKCDARIRNCERLNITGKDLNSTDSADFSKAMLCALERIRQNKLK